MAQIDSRLSQNQELRLASPRGCDYDPVTHAQTPLIKPISMQQHNRLAQPENKVQRTKTLAYESNSALHISAMMQLMQEEKPGRSGRPPQKQMSFKVSSLQTKL